MISKSVFSAKIITITGGVSGDSPYQRWRHRACYKISCDMKKVTRIPAYPILYYLKLRETRTFAHTREATDE